MANPELNANAMVARWNESHQKAGFVFLVTQIMGYLTGGPACFLSQRLSRGGCTGIKGHHCRSQEVEWDYGDGFRV